MAGLDISGPFLRTDWMLGLFSDLKSQARHLYISFVQAGLEMDSPLKTAKGGLILGSEAFIERFRGLLEESSKGEESVRREKYAARPSLKELFESLDRDDAIHDAVLKWGYKLKEVSEHVGLHYSRVSRLAALMAEPNKAKNKT